MTGIIRYLILPGIALLWMPNLDAQFNVVKMLDQAPLIPPTIGKAFLGCKLITTSETLLDGREFKRVKSWEPAGEIKKFGDMIDTYLEKIDQRAETNSFSVNYNPSTDSTAQQFMNYMTLQADTLKKIWSAYHKKIAAVNPDFLPLNEEYGCDEIAASGILLNGFATEKNKILNEAREALKSHFDLVQRYFNKLYQIDDAMFNNQVLNEISKPLQVLQQWSFEVNSANSHMVETGVSLNDALCVKEQ